MNLNPTEKVKYKPTKNKFENQSHSCEVQESKKQCNHISREPPLAPLLWRRKRKRGRQEKVLLIPNSFRL